MVEQARVAELVYTELIPVKVVITAAPSESDVEVSDAIRVVHDGFPVKSSSGAPVLSAESSSDQTWGFSIYALYSC